MASLLICAKKPDELGVLVTSTIGKYKSHRQKIDELRKAGPVCIGVKPNRRMRRANKSKKGRA